MGHWEVEHPTLREAREMLASFSDDELRDMGHDPDALREFAQTGDD
jgi:hypothetical protein